MSDPAEEALLYKARAGSRAAFDRLQATLERPVRRFIRRLIGRSLEEDDIVREAFLALYQNLPRLYPADRLRPFLFRVVRNLCYDELRRKGRFELVSLEEAVGDADAPLLFIPDCRPPPDEVTHWTLLYAEVRKAMERLPELQRQTMILYFEEDFTYAQIAEAMATDIGTVKSRIHYARQNLVRLLRPDIVEALGVKKEK